MIDAELLADLRRLLDALRKPEWQLDLERAVPDDLVKQISADFRNYDISPRSPLNTPAQTVSVVGAGVVKGGDVGPQHRPVDPSATNSGWVEAKSIDSWRAPGLEHMDRMMDQQDAIDRAARARELAEAAAVQRALKQSVEPKAQEPKARGDKKA
jgi:hypothetical protein